MSFHEDNFEQIKIKNANISNFDLLSTNYVGIDFVKIRKTALLGIADKYTITPIKNFLARTDLEAKLRSC